MLWEPFKRLIGLKPPPKSTFDTGTIYDACKKASETLNEILGTHDIEIRLAGVGEEKILENYAADWGKSGSDTHFFWESHVLFPNPKKQTFCIALFKGYTLCGLCENGVTVDAHKREKLDIKYIEAHPDKSQNPLRGLVIAAFAQANLEIAKAMNVPSIGVDTPFAKTIPTYLRMGFRPKFRLKEGFQLERSVAKGDRLNWEGYLNRRARKGFSIPAHS